MTTTEIRELHDACRMALMEITTDDARRCLCRRYGEAHWRQTVDALEAAIKGVSIEGATEDEIAEAREIYQSDCIEIDDDAAISRHDSGRWIAAWVHVPSLKTAEQLSAIRVRR